MTVDPSPVYDDEIDLRALFRSVWKARTAIFIATLAAAVVAFTVSFWFLPRKYEATAYVFIGRPVVDILQDAGITISPVLPDMKSVTQLAASPGLLERVIRDPVVVEATGNEEIPIAKIAVAADVGPSQLRLQVTDTDPQLAALLANVWAEKVTTMVNTIYGVGAIAQTLDSQVLQSQQAYEQAQTALEDALSENRVDELGAQLDSKRAERDIMLASYRRSTGVLYDLQIFEQILNGVPGETTLSLGDGLALTILRQRSLTVAEPDNTIQIDSASFTEFTVSKALSATAQMRAALQTQLTRLQSDQLRLDQEIPQLQRDLSNADAQLYQFTTKRDQTQGLYTALLQQQQRVTKVLLQSAQVATVSVEAVPSKYATSPKVLVNTAVAGMLGLLLSVFGVLAANWWKKA